MPPYWFYVISEIKDGSLADFGICPDGFYFSASLWESVQHLAGPDCKFIGKSADGGLKVFPTNELCCMNDIAAPVPGEELVCLSQSSGNIAIVTELPNRLYVTDKIVSLVAGKGFTGIGFLELRDELDGRRPTFSFLRKLPALRREDPLLDAIANFCSDRGLNLIRFTLADENYQFEERVVRAVWFLVDSAPLVAFFLDGEFNVFDEAGKKVNVDTD